MTQDGSRLKRLGTSVESKSCYSCLCSLHLATAVLSKDKSSGYDIDLVTPLLLLQSHGAMMQVPTGCSRLLWRHLQSTCTTQISSRLGILAVGHIIHQATAS